MTHENGKDGLIRKALTGTGILAIGFFGGRLASVTTATGEAKLEWDRVHARIALRTPHGGLWEGTFDVFGDMRVVAFDTQVDIPGVGGIRGGFVWANGPFGRLQLVGPRVQPGPSDESS